METILDICEERDIPRERLLSQANLLEIDLSQDINAESFVAIVKAAIKLTDDPDLGFHYGASQNLMKHGIVGAAALASPNAMEAVYLFAKFLSAGRRAFLYLDPIESDDHLLLRIRVNTELHEIETFIIDSAMVGGKTMGSSLGNKNEDPGVFAQLKRDFPSQYYRKQIPKGIDITFNSNDNVVYLKKEILLKPNPFQNSMLLKVLSARLKELENQSRTITPKNTILTLKALSKDNDTVPTKSEVARMLNVSERTLTRKLSHYSTSFNDILTSYRKSRARSLLQDTDTTLADIAGLLGYNDTGNFSKAFKRWFGVSPREFRKNNNTC